MKCTVSEDLATIEARIGSGGGKDEGLHRVHKNTAIEGAWL